MRPEREDGCGVCGNRVGNRDHAAREMMFGTREPFTYRECGRCGTLALVDPPADLSAYYPDTYYSTGTGDAPASVPARMIRGARSELALRLPRRVAGVGRLSPGTRVLWFHGVATTGSRIVDVGSGAGHNLQHLWNSGFRHVVGYDPYFRAGERAPFEVHQQIPDWFAGHFDVAMMHHAFEHVADPVAQLRLLSSLLRPGGRILLRIPLADSWAWEHYGVDWVQLDPPRHRWLFTERALGVLAGSVGLRVRSTWRDSTPFQFWGSELFTRDEPLLGAGPPSDPAVLDELRRRAEELNRAGRGDQGVFWLEPGPASR